MVIDENKLQEKLEIMMSNLDEHTRRLYLASEAEILGHGGVAVISRLTDVDRHTISKGIKEIKDNLIVDSDGKHKTDNIDGITTAGKQRVRKKGGGRKPITKTDPEIVDALLSLVDKESYGNPENPLRWTCKSTRILADELTKEGHPVSHNAVYDLLASQGFTMQTNRKLLQNGKPHPDRNSQFQHINDTVLAYSACGQPVISIDCKKKENIGQYKNEGAEFHEKGAPEIVLDHDFIDKDKGKVSPYGIYDIANNEGYVNVGISSDTAQFAANSIRCWWNEMGRGRFPHANKLYITADGGGSNGSRCKLWKIELQKLSTEFGIDIEVSHFPPGTSKWNKIEHRLFSWISKNWRGRPLTTIEVVIELISATTTEAGLKVKCGLDTNEYATGLKVADEELNNINISRNSFHGEWNYIISPQKT